MVPLLTRGLLTQPLLTISPQAAPPTEPPAALHKEVVSDIWWIISLTLVNASTRALFQSTFRQKTSGFLASIWLIFPCSQDLTALSILRSLPSISSSSIVFPASF